MSIACWQATKSDAWPKSISLADHRSPITCPTLCNSQPDGIQDMPLRIFWPSSDLTNSKWPRIFINIVMELDLSKLLTMHEDGNVVGICLLRHELLEESVPLLRHACDPSHDCRLINTHTCSLAPTTTCSFIAQFLKKALLMVCLWHMPTCMHRLLS